MLDKEPAATREQLIAAAAAVFADAGFRGATVRDICQRAGANVAAVNYHFGGKQGLYTEVLRRHYQRALDRFPGVGAAPRKAPAEERLLAFVRSFLQRIFAEGLDSCHGRLLAREMIEPTPALDELVAVEIRALADQLTEIVGDLLPAARRRDEVLVRLCMGSVVSQIVFYLHCQPVIQRLFPRLQFSASNLEALARHITRFSLAGIRELGRARTPVSS